MRPNFSMSAFSLSNKLGFFRPKTVAGLRHAYPTVKHSTRTPNPSLAKADLWRFSSANCMCPVSLSRHLKCSQYMVANRSCGRIVATGRQHPGSHSIQQIIMEFSMITTLLAPIRVVRSTAAKFRHACSQIWKAPSRYQTLKRPMRV